MTFTHTSVHAENVRDMLNFMENTATQDGGFAVLWSCFLALKHTTQSLSHDEIGRE